VPSIIESGKQFSFHVLVVVVVVVVVGFEPLTLLPSYPDDIDFAFMIYVFGAWLKSSTTQCVDARFVF
jgi:hypothetical protein